MKQCMIPVISMAVLILTGCGGGEKTEGDADVDPMDEQIDSHDAVHEDVQPDIPSETSDPAEDEPAVDTPDDPAEDTAPDTTDTTADQQEDPAPDMVEDVPEDSEPEVACILEGCLFGGDLRCCGAMEPETECFGEECTDEFCINCGDGVCDPHENCHNCLEDCTTPCTKDDSVILACSPIETHHCTCKPDMCVPECRPEGASGSGWYDPCTDALLKAEEGCEDATVSCDAVCSRSEGWYSSETGLIAWDFCRNEWVCEIVW